MLSLQVFAIIKNRKNGNELEQNGDLATPEFARVFSHILKTLTDMEKAKDEQYENLFGQLVALKTAVSSFNLPSGAMEPNRNVENKQSLQPSCLD